MANSYIITEETDITRNEGDSNVVVITVSSDILDLSTYSTCKFQVRNEEDVDRTQTPVISKDTSDGIVISGQTATVTIDPADTKNKYGSDYRWEVQFSDGTDIATLMRGAFIIDKEIIT